MAEGRVAPISESDVTAWRRDRADAGSPLPGALDGETLEALEVVVDDVAVGGVLLGHAKDAAGARAAIRYLQTTLPDDATDQWAAALAALEAHLRARGVASVTTAVPPGLAGVFGTAGYRSTMRTHSRRADPETLVPFEDRRVSVRPMDREERRRYADDVREILRAGTERAGLDLGRADSLADLEERLSRFGAEEAPHDEVLMTAVVDDGTAVGRAWGSLVEDGGAVDFLGNAIDLFPEFRGQGLTLSLYGALTRHVLALGVRDVRVRVYGYDQDARRTFDDSDFGVDDVHLRKDLS